MSRRSPVTKFLPPENTTQQDKQLSKDSFPKIPKDLLSRKQNIEETFRMLEIAVEQSIDGIAIADMEGTIRFCNHAWAHMHGYHVFELIGKHLSIFHNEEQMKRDVIPFNDKVLKSGSFSGEVGHVSKDGTAFDTWMTTSLLKNERGKPIGFLGIARNITEQKQMHKALVFSEKKYRKLFEDSIEGIGISKGNRVITANKATLEIFGYQSVEEFTKVPLLFHVALESRDMIKERMRKRQMGEWVEPRFEYKIIRKDGEIRDVQASSSNITIDNERYVQTTFRDITEQKRTYQQLQVCLKEWEVAFNSASDLLMLLDNQFTILRANEACAQFINKPLNLIVGKKCYEVFHGSDTPPDDCLLKKTLNTKKHEEQEIFLSGRDSWFQLSVDPILDEKNNLVGAVHVTKDITEIKKTAQRISKINDCFVGFGADPDKNINSLVSLCGEVMGAACALYSRLEKDMLYSTALWQVPTDFNPINKAEGLICYDVIKRGKEGFFVVRNLDKTHYAQTDPYVLKYNLKTYIGLPINFENNTIGSLCVVYQKDFIPSQEDKRFMQIIASAIAIEEKRRLTKEAEAIIGERYRTLIENVGIGIFRLTGADITKGKFIEANSAIVKMFGYNNKEEFISVKSGDLYVDGKAIEQILRKIFKEGYVKDEELSLKKKDGTIFTASVSVAGVKDETGRVQYLDGIIEDITQHKKVEEVLQRRDYFLNNVFESIRDGISVSDKEMRIVRVNSVMEEWYKHALPLVGKKCYEAYHGRDKHCEVCPTIKTLQTGKPAYEVVPWRDKEGKIIGWFDLYSFPLIDTKTNEITGVIEYVRNITQRKLAEEESEKLNEELLRTNKRLRQLVLRDPQTGLYNHRYLQEVIEAEFCRAQRYTQPLSVIMLDIDYFKSINDTYGHQFGDLILKQFSRELKKMMRKYDTIVRFGGEEFIIISPEINKPTALSLAQRILDTIALSNFGNEEQNVKLKLSLAIASYPDDRVVKGMALVELAELILNKAKEDGGDRAYSSKDIEKQKDTVLEKIKKRVDIKFLRGKIDRLNKRANQSLIESVLAFAKTIKLKDNYTGEHVESTVRYAMQIAEKLNLNKEEIENIRRASMLHDLGKIGISERILNKKRKLTPREFSVIKKHPQIGADILRQIHFLRDIVPLIHYHHERWDGKGYPCGLRNEEIPIGARIVAIADVFQALISDRPYRRAYPEDKAKEIIQQGAGAQFDPKIVDIFLKILQG